MKDLKLAVGGLHCAACASELERSLHGLDGVIEVSVSYALQTAIFSYDESRIVEGALAMAVANAGYDTRILDNDGITTADGTSRTVMTAAQRAAGSMFLTIPAVLVQLFAWFFPQHSDYAQPARWIALSCTALVVVAFGWQIHVNMVRQIRRLTANMDTLISLGTLAAFITSVYNNWSGASHAYFDSAGLIMSFVLLGRYLEAKSRGHASSAVERLQELKTGTTVIRRGTELIAIPTREVRSGDMVVIESGQRVPVDGIVAEGEAIVDQSIVTGEAMARTKRVGEVVYAGSLNQSAALVLTATRVDGHTVIDQLIRIVEVAQRHKGHIEKVVDTVSRFIAPLVFVVATVTFASWYLATGDFQKALWNGLAVLVIASPCAIGLATPVALLIAMAKGGSLGIIIKDGEAMEVATAIRTIVFDKTGTLTEGRPRVTEVRSCREKFSDDEVLRLAASVETLSEHPLALAIRAAASERQLWFGNVSDYSAIPGRGVVANLDGKRVSVGNGHLVGTDDPAIEQTCHTVPLEMSGRTVVRVAVDGQMVGIVGISDVVKSSAKEAVAVLKQRGYEVIMLTGDNALASRAIGKELGIDHVLAEVLPDAKAGEIKRLQANGRRVAFVGDGVNDAPALMQADLGIAVGTGTDIAMESGNVVIMTGEPEKVVEALELAKRTMAIIRQNIFWAFFYNLLAVPIAAFGWLSPMLGAGAMAVSTLTVILNSYSIKLTGRRPVSWH